MSPRVLVAEGSATLQALIRMTLEGDGLIVHCVGDGRAALAAWREQPPRLLIADAALPGIDGYTLVEHLRAEMPGPGLQVLLLTSDHETPDLERLDHLGIQDVLTKPFEQHDLLERVRGMLGRRADTIGDDAPTPGPDVRSPAMGSGRAFTPPRSSMGSARTVGQMSPPDENHATPNPAITVPEHLVREAVNTWLANEGREVVLASIEKVVWKVVPELAERMIREEIQRLTEEGDE